MLCCVVIGMCGWMKRGLVWRRASFPSTHERVPMDPNAPYLHPVSPTYPPIHPP